MTEMVECIRDDWTGPGSELPDRPRRGGIYHVRCIEPRLIHESGARFYILAEQVMQHPRGRPVWLETHFRPVRKPDISCLRDLLKTPRKWPIRA